MCVKNETETKAIHIYTLTKHNPSKQFWKYLMAVMIIPYGILVLSHQDRKCSRSVLEVQGALACIDLKTRNFENPREMGIVSAPP